MSTLKHIGDPIRRSRVLWACICWALVGILLWFGGPFLIFGAHATSFPGAYEAVSRYVPGGLRTYGGLMVLLGLWIAYGLLPGLHGQPIMDGVVHVALGATSGFAVGIVIGFVGSQALTGLKTYQADGYWLSVAFIAWVCTFFAPSDGPGRVA